MIPISTILILLTIVSLFYVLLSFFTSSPKKRKENLFRILSRLGVANHLTFCSQDCFQDKVIGIDGIHRKIMILEKGNDGYHYSIISLDEVHDCQLVTKSGSINNFKKMNGENYPGTLELQFDFNNHAQTTFIVFSSGFANSKREFGFLKAKAEYWCIMFSKMLTQHMEVRA